MFVVTDSPQFTHTVTAMVPIDGGHEEQSFKVTYRTVQPEEMASCDLGTRAGTEKFLLATIVALGDLVGPDKKAIPYSDKVRDQVIALPWARSAIAKGYFNAIAKSAEGN